MPDPISPSRVLLNVGETLAVGARSGIPRVVMKLASALAARTQLDLVRWDPVEGRLRFADRSEFDHLFGRGAWPEGLRPRSDARRLRVRFGDLVPATGDVWLVQPEIPYHSAEGLQAFAAWTTQAREYGWRTSAVVYDMIPLHNPAYAEGRAKHVRYHAELLRADLLTPISRQSAADLRAYLSARGLEGPPIVPVPLGEADASDPVDVAASTGERTILVLGTVEPRKHQLDVVRAYAKARTLSPAVAAMQLLVVGSLHPAVAKEFEALVGRTEGARFRAYLPEAELSEAWRDAAFSVFASDDEGFGLPVAESLARGLPCVVVDKPPMTEIAGGAGLLRVASPSPDALCAALVTLAGDPLERRRLREQIAARRLRTWGDYADDMLAAMAQAAGAQTAPARPVKVRAPEEPPGAWADDDGIRFLDASRRDAFVAASAQERAPAMLPALTVAGERDPAAALHAFRSRLTRIARSERRYGQAMRVLGREAEERPCFLRIVVSTYNRREFVLENVRWLLDHVIRNRSDVELVVVDNASTDGSGAALRQGFQGRRVRIVENAANVGMLGNMRVCSQIPGAEYVWLIGDDDFIITSQLDPLLDGLRANRGAPLAYLNFAVYYREALGALDTPEVLQAEGRPLATTPIPSGAYPLHVAAAQHDNLFTAIYINVWRADVLAAAYDHPFDGRPFSSLVESIPCTKTLLESFGECEIYWHAPAAIVGNAHNSWVRHRPRWHGRLMPEALMLARDAGVQPEVLQPWADHQAALYDEARELARAAGRGLDMDEPDAFDLSWPLFRRRLAGEAS